MTSEAAFWMLFAGAFLWIAFWLAGSAIFRRSSGKPIMPRPPPDAAFVESGCSGRSLANLVTRLGGASRCLLIYVEKNELVVTPTFPFTLAFLPEIYGLEFRAPIKDISARVSDGIFGRMVRLESRSGLRPPMELRLQDIDGLLGALDGKPRPADPSDGRSARKPHLRLRTVFMSGFLLLWASGAFTYGATSLHTDFDFRSHGLTAEGVIVGSDQAGGGGNAIVRYAVGSHAYSLRSLRGSGTYKIGDQEGLKYLPNAPEAAREDDYLSFDLIWVVAGLVALTIGLAMIAGPWMLRRR